MKAYLGAGIVCFCCGTVLPGTWLMRQPNLFEAAQLSGVALLLAAAYVSLVKPRLAAMMALAGTAAIASFVVHALVTMGRERPVALIPAALALALCLAVVVMAVRKLQGHGTAAGRPPSRAWTVVWPTLLAVLLLAYFWPWRGRRDPSRYLVPESYVGWVVIEYDVAGAPALPIRNGAVEVAIPFSGRLKTSSGQEYGFALDDWESVSAAGLRTRMIDPEAHGSRVWRWSAGSLEVPGKPDVHSEQFFVGTEEQLQAVGEKTYPENLQP